MMMMMIRLCVL